MDKDSELLLQKWRQRVKKILLISVALILVIFCWGIFWFFTEKNKRKEIRSNNLRIVKNYALNEYNYPRKLSGEEKELIIFTKNVGDIENLILKIEGDHKRSTYPGSPTPTNYEFMQFCEKNLESRNTWEIIHPKNYPILHFCFGSLIFIFIFYGFFRNKNLSLTKKEKILLFILVFLICIISAYLFSLLGYYLSISLGMWYAFKFLI